MSPNALVNRGREIKRGKKVGKKTCKRGGRVKGKMPIGGGIKGGKSTDEGKRG